MTARFLVSHPHAGAVANDVASALASHGHLARYVTGIAAARESLVGNALDRFAAYRPAVANRVVAGVDRSQLQSLAPLELLARGAARAGLGVSAYDAMFVAHDTAVARLPWPRDTTGVYAFEDGARSTFERAARLGLERAWDLPAPYWPVSEAMWQREGARWPGATGIAPPSERAWKVRRKEAEILLATRIVVASRFTRDSLAGAPRNDARVAVVPYAFPIDTFAPRAAPPSGPFTVIAVGSHDLRKGTPYLLEAWRRAALRDARLVLVGPLRLAESFVAPYRHLFQHVPHVPRRLLASHYASADLLAFPTLGDGFGLVIVEAMSVGTPVLTTRCGGGPECITSGEDGWIVPPADVDALVTSLREAHADRDRVAAVGRAARVRAEQYDHAAFARALTSALGLGAV